MLRCIFCSILLFSIASAHADDIADKGRALFSKFQRAVVAVRVAATMTQSRVGFTSQTNEVQQTISGTIISGSGLAAVSLAQVDAQEMMANLPQRDPRVRMEIEVTDIRMVLEDGQESPAEVVQRDRDLEVALIRPKAKPATPPTALDLSQAGSAQVLDPVIALNRLGPAAGRAYSASVERIAAIIIAPRLFYIPDSNMTTSTLGSPAFTLDGKVIGVFVLRSSRNTAPSGTQSESFSGVIAPAKDVLELAKKVTQ